MRLIEPVFKRGQRPDWLPEGDIWVPDGWDLRDLARRFPGLIGATSRSRQGLPLGWTGPLW